MEEQKLLQLYNECIKELQTIGIDMLSPDMGSIDIKISNRSKKRYGCCKQEEPDKSKQIFRKHHIEISRWVLDLNEDIIKNTIIHELIHCIPYCNNHGKVFKSYAKLINEKLGYNISRLGNKEVDYKISNIEYKEEKPNFKYKIICQGCGQEVLRQRVNKNFTRKYRCGKCGGKFKVLSIDKTIQ